MTKVYSRLLKWVKPYSLHLLLAMFCMLIVAGATAATAYLVKPVLDKIFFEKKIRMLFILPPLVVLLYAVKGAFWYLQNYLMNYVGQRIVCDMRERLYTHMLQLPLSYFQRHHTGTLMSRILNDVTLIQGAVSGAVTRLLCDSFTIIGLIGVVFYRDFILATITMIVFPLAIMPVMRIGRKIRKISTSSQEEMGELSSLLNETFSGARIVKAFGMEDYEKGRFQAVNNRLFHWYMRAVKMQAITSPLMEFLGSIGIASVIGYGGYRVINGISTPGNFFSFIAGVMMLYRPIKGLSNVYNTVQQGIAAAIRVFEVLDTETERKDEVKKELPCFNDTILYKQVWFKYPGEKEWILKGINLCIKKGQKVALVGPSGAGKTTIVNLLPRFYDINKGKIIIDGHDINEINLRSLRAQIAIVSQDTILFNDTVKNNIRYGRPDATDEEVIAAAKAAYAYDFIKKLPQEFETIIGERGIRLSGGEQQRICIARAILKNAPILILDEATSFLDTESEAMVQKALENLLSNRTALIIAHRLSTIIRADKIAVVNNGHIVEEGKHEELLSKNGFYARLYKIQFREE
ncbi:MAG TPA: lipid A export permease/ATP-binding protein MsbA [Candidatus Desulfofervidus auxilii]|uniref:Lipid A export permease/ATP-binding protein MsbA n=1 Tax=Desulfofervidus auxilii TaxID=1621989 RepID=A0A7V0IA64_DESA2|nr:lipid A export permease/ATP-binding protein MsbA [Candidatus Desulfofervidus auxilii]